MHDFIFKIYFWQIALQYIKSLGHNELIPLCIYQNLIKQFAHFHLFHVLLYSDILYYGDDRINIYLQISM